MDTPEYSSTVFRYRYQSLVEPPSVSDFEMTSGKSTVLKKEQVLGGYDASRYASERLWITARDGVQVPMSIVYRKDRVRDGKAPLWLYAYGSYGYGLQANFDSRRVSLLDRGFAFAIVHVRGGDEMGEAWHDDGMLMKKSNTFTDFIDAAEYLIESRWTSKDGLVIEGGSAGGLLMGAVTNLRPGPLQGRSFSCAVRGLDEHDDGRQPSLDRGRVPRMGQSKRKVCVRLHALLQSLRQPAQAGLPGHPRDHELQRQPGELLGAGQYVAKLRTLKTDANPLLLKIKMGPAGHGGASGRYDALEDRAFEMAWMMQQVGIAK